MAKRNPNLKKVPYSSLRRNVKTCNYIDAKGKFIPKSKIADVIDSDIELSKVRRQKASATLQKQAQKRLDGKIGERAYLNSVKRWQDAMAAESKASVLANVAAGRGGFHTVTQADYGRAGAFLKTQYQALNGFASDCAASPEMVANGIPGKMDFMQRTDLYADAGWAMYMKTEHLAHLDQGFKSVSNILDAQARHCIECPKMTYDGPWDIDDPGWIIPGFRTCKMKCRCRAEYSMQAKELIARVATFANRVHLLLQRCLCH